MSENTNEPKFVRDAWKSANPEQVKALLEGITAANCGEKLKLVRTLSAMTKKDLAKTLGVSESTISRLETGRTRATDEFLYRLYALVVIGHAKYSKMTNAEKESISECIAAGGGIAAGVGGAIAAVSASGAVAGLSAAGITSGLAALGGTILGGIGVVAAIPVAAGFAGYGLVKGIKAICEANRLNCHEIDGHFEIAPQDEGRSQGPQNKDSDTCE